MNPIEQEGIVARLAQLEDRLRRTERRAQLRNLCWLTLTVLFALVSWAERSNTAQGAVTAADKLRVREIDVVDEKGRERIVLAAPLPEPLVDGKVRHRIRPVSAAVQFKAANGNEQGGVAMSDDGSMVFGIDDERISTIYQSGDPACLSPEKMAPISFFIASVGVTAVQA